MKLIKLTSITVSFVLLSMLSFAQHDPGNNTPVFIAPVPDIQYDLLYSSSTLGWKKEFFNLYTDEYRTIGNFKVKGNSLLFRGHNETIVYTKKGFAKNVPVMLDVYKEQHFGVLVDNNNSLLNIAFNDLDSFVVLKDSVEPSLVSVPAMFINASIFDKSKKSYMQRLVNGERYGLYKSYKAEMVPASNDIAQTNLQQFEMTNDYYYYDKTAKTLKRIKPNSSFLRDEFNGNTAALEVLKKISFDKESKQASLITFFNSLK